MDERNQIGVLTQFILARPFPETSPTEFETRRPPRGPQEASRKLPAGPKSAPRSLLLLIFIFLFLFAFTLPHMFPEGFPNRLGEHIVQ